MDKKIFALLIVFIAAISIASVSAVDLNTKKDFDGLFSMKISGEDNFTQFGDPQDYSTIVKARAAYINNDSIFVLVYDNNLATVISMVSENQGVNSTQDGNLLMFNATPAIETALDHQSSTYKIDGLKDKITTFAGTTNDDDTITVFIAGNNATLVKEYAKTIEFNK
ncbi:hypothetical protein [Methanobrevibacter sp.]